MSDPEVIAGWLLLAGPVLGLIPVAHPALISIWSMPREAFVAAVSDHRVAWAWLNGGFALASIATTAGLLVVAGVEPDPGAAAVLLACAVGYAVGAVLWCAVLAIRTRTTPLLAPEHDVDSGAGETDRTAARLLEAATTGLFHAFVVITACALVGLSAVLLLTDASPVWVAATLLLTGTAVAIWLLRTGDVIPAVVYVPTALLGVTLL